MTIGALKLDGLKVSNKAVTFIAKCLSKRQDAITAFMETDTHPDGRVGLWARLRSRLFRRTPFRAPANDVPMAEMVPGRYYALSVFVNTEHGMHEKITVHPGVEVCCREGEDKVKGLLLRTVSVGDDGLLLVVGLAFSPDDDAKAAQIRAFVAEVARRRADAAASGRKLQVIAAGDVNTRLVLPESVGWETELAELPGKEDDSLTVTTRKLTESSIDKLMAMLVRKDTRKELLNWEAWRFGGTAVGNVTYRPMPEMGDLRSMMYFMTDWWKDKDKTPEMVSYKRSPWFDRVEEDYLQWMVEQDKCRQPDTRFMDADSGEVLTTAEIGDDIDEFLEQACAHQDPDERLACERKHEVDLDFSVMLAEMERRNDRQWVAKSDDQASDSEDILEKVFFGMKGKIAKTSGKSDEVQAYLNQDQEGNPIYLQIGWLDAIGVSREGFARKKFKDFDNEMDIWAFDHLFVKARVEFQV